MQLTHDKLVTRTLLHQMHPDLFEATPQMKFLARAWDDRDALKDTQEFWLAINAELGIDFPADFLSTHAKMVNITKYGTENNQYEINEAETVKEFARIVKWAVAKGYKVTKEYEGSLFNLRVETPKLNGSQRLSFYASRDIMCTRVHIGTEVVPAQPSKVVDKYDWNCEKLSFLGVDTEDE